MPVTLSLEAAVVGVYFIIILGLGFYFRNKDEEDEFWTAEGKIPLSVNALAIFASYSSGGALMGMMGIAYASGAPFAWSISAGSFIGLLLGAFLIAKPCKSIDRYTITDLFDFLYNSKIINVIVPIAVIAGFWIYILAQLIAGGFIGQYVLGIEYFTAVVTVGLIFAVYVSLGGMWAISITDGIQGGIMVLTVLLLGAASFTYFGGDITAPLVETPTIVELLDMPVEHYIGAFLVWAVGTPVLAHVIMRVFSSKTPGEARKAFGWAAFLYGATALIAYYLVTSVVISFESGLDSPDQAVLIAIGELYGPIVGGLMLAGILAAVMSTTDGLLLAMSAALTNDLYKQHFNPDASHRTIKMLSKGSIWFFALVAIAVSYEPPALIVSLFSYGVGLMGAGFFIPMVLGIWWRRINKTGGVAGMVGGMSVYVIFAVIYSQPFIPIIPALVAAIAGCIIGSLMTAPTPERTMKMSKKLDH